jgi:hypothetical protein
VTRQASPAPLAARRSRAGDDPTRAQSRALTGSGSDHRQAHGVRSTNDVRGCSQRNHWASRPRESTSATRSRCPVQQRAYRHAYDFGASESIDGFARVRTWWRPSRSACRERGCSRSPVASARPTVTWQGLHSTVTALRRHGTHQSRLLRQETELCFKHIHHQKPVAASISASVVRRPPQDGGSKFLNGLLPVGRLVPARPGIAPFARSSYVNRALFGISTSAVACGSFQRLPRRACVPMIGRAGHTRLGTRRLSVGGGRCPEMQGVARVRTMPSEQEESARDSSLWQ